MKLFKDQLNRTIEINFPPKRIISLVPSQTELLYYLGLDKEIVGITKFCIHPKEKFNEKTKIGGTKKLKLDQIRVLKPDVIIASKEENSQQDIETLEKEFPIWISDIQTLEDAYKMITDIGILCNKTEKIHDLISDIKHNFKSIPKFKTPLKVAYLIWNRPMMSVSKNTFINDILSKSGFINVLESYNKRYPEISEDDLIKTNPDFIFLSSEPYPFKEKHIKEFIRKFPKSKSILVNGEMFSWYGSRLKEFNKYFQEEIYPLVGIH